MTNGGIDLTASKLNLQAKNDGIDMKFHLNPAQLAEFQNARGFTPQIIAIKPLNSLSQFLGLQIPSSNN